MNDVMGIVYTSKDDLTLRELTSQRAVAAIPVAGRYRIIDFVISNFVKIIIKEIIIFVTDGFLRILFQIIVDSRSRYTQYSTSK